MSLHGAGNPQAVDVKPAACFNGHPCVFRRNIFNKALSALLAAIKDKSLIKSLLQPLLFRKSLLAGHGAADMIPVDVFFCYMDIFHRSSPDFLHIYCIISRSKAHYFDSCGLFRATPPEASAFLGEGHFKPEFVCTMFKI